MAIKELKIDLKPLLGKLTLRPGHDVTGSLTGAFSTVYKGTGLEFGGYRKYTPSDDAKSIDWKASVRSQSILVRELIEEKNLNIYFLVDISNSMLFASTDKMKCEYAAELVATMAFAIIRSGDSVGLMMFNDKIITVVEPNLGEEQYYRVIHEISNPQNYGGKFNLAEALHKISARLRRQRALIVLVSDFIGVKGQEWKDHVKNIATAFEIFPIMVRDPRDTKLPQYTGQIVISDPYTGEEMVIDPSLIKDEFELHAKEEEIKIINTFKQYNTEVLRLSTDEAFMKPLIGYIRKKGG